MAEPRYRIGTVAKLAGLSTHAIRAWERRYEALSPKRSAGGARLYSDEEVSRLRLLKRVLDRGHAIGQVVGLDNQALERLANPSSSTPLAPLVDGEPARLVTELVQAAAAIDAPRAERLLDRAEATLSARALVQQVLAPLLTAVGAAWLAGEVCTASEHMASVLVRERVTAVFRRFPQEAGRPKVLVTTPAGELHELGALLAAATLAMHGANLVYLGPNLPVTEIVTAARAIRVDVVALSIVALPTSEAAAQLSALAKQLPSAISLVVGGATAHLLRELVDPRIVLLTGLVELETWFENR